jgi:hypothetical protein
MVKRDTKIKYEIVPTGICIGVCTLNEHLICYGCGRTMQEIEASGDIRSLPIVVRKNNPIKI